MCYLCTSYYCTVLPNDKMAKLSNTLNEGKGTLRQGSLKNGQNTPNCPNLVGGTQKSFISVT